MIRMIIFNLLLTNVFVSASDYDFLEKEWIYNAKAFAKKTREHIIRSSMELCGKFGEEQVNRYEIKVLNDFEQCTRDIMRLSREKYYRDERIGVYQKAWKKCFSEKEEFFHDGVTAAEQKAVNCKL